MSGNRVADALRRCLSSKEGEIVLQYLVDASIDGKQMLVHAEHGADPLQVAFRNGVSCAYQDLLRMAGYEATFKRIEDARTTDGHSGAGLYDTGRNPYRGANPYQ